MAFESISQKLQNILKKITGKGKLNQEDIKLAMREVKLALLEADVNFNVVKEFIDTVSKRAVGAEVMESLTPGQQVVKIVNEEMIALMGGENAKLEFGSTVPAVILLAGLQGAGKTTMAGKLAGYLKKQFNKSPMLVACDVYRPAAIKQLQIVGESVGVPVFEMGTGNPVETAKKSIEQAKRSLKDVVIIDTAGRLHIDENMMQEIKAIKNAVKPSETLLVIDAMIGQDSVNVANQFNQLLDLSGIILTKLDGDARGGAAISVKAVTGKPIKLVGTGEKLSDIEAFYPERMVSRILGMGDILSLIEKAQENFDAKKAMELEAKFKNDEFTLDDFLDQFQQVKKMGSMQDILGMMPGMDASKLGNVEISEKQTAHMEAIIRSMTPDERTRPHIINASRKKRVASGSGTSVQEVNKLLNQFEATKKMMKQFAGAKGKKGKFRLPFGM